MLQTKILFVHGRVHEEGWEIMGIYSLSESAVAACKQGNDFVGPCPLDTALPEERTEWPGAWYPLA